MKKEKLLNKMFLTEDETHPFIKPPKNQIKTILVDNCQDCPFGYTHHELTYLICAINTIDRLPDELPKDKVSDKCPLRNINYRVRLK